jgi:2Fe-2S ferredoxin
MHENIKLCQLLYPFKVDPKPGPRQKLSRIDKIYDFPHPYQKLEINMEKVTINVTTRTGANVTLDAQAGHPLMEPLRDKGLVEALCGGQAACATCHIHVDQAWMAIVGNAEGQEADMLDTSLEKQHNSRLSCQIIVDENLDGLTIAIAPFEG